MKRFILAALVGVLISGPAYAEGWSCIAEQSAGVRYDEKTGKWVSTKFKSGEEYVIRRPDPKTNGFAWKIYRFDAKSAEFGCARESGYLSCVTFGAGSTHTRNSGFDFDEKTLRFISWYLVGFLRQGTAERPDNNNNTPALTIGTCRPL